MNVQAGSQTFDNIDGAGEGAEQVARIAVAYGDGIGPEIMTASLSVLHEAGARLEIQNVVSAKRHICPAIPQGWTHRLGRTS